jgi:hypothetical protein
MKKHFYVLLIVLAYFLHTANVYAQGTDCASATAAVIGINAADGPADGDGASNLCQTGADNADWYFYTPVTDVYITLESCLQGIDTRVSVYEGTCDALACLTFNDDECLMIEGGNEFAAAISFNGFAGNTYLIEWDDRWSGFAFDWTLTESDLVTEVPECPALISPEDDAIDVVIDEDNMNAVNFVWELSTSGDSPNAVEFFLGIAPDALISLGTLDAIETTDPTNFQFGTTYYWSVVPSNVIGSAMDCPVFSFTTVEDIDDCPSLMLDFGEDCDDMDSNTVLDIVQDDCTCAGTPNSPNGICADALILEEGILLGVQVVGGAGASNICFPGATNSIWYTFTAAGTGSCTLNSSIDLDLPDTRVHISTGTCDDLTCLIFDDDGGEGFTSLLTFDVAIGETYFVEWDDRWSDDAFDFEFTCDLGGIDTDMDGVLDDDDNCPNDPNTNQSDIDNDGFGDECDVDIDGDGVLNDDDCSPLEIAIFEGASCDDGDASTLNDIYDSTCICVGTPGQSNVRLLVVNVVDQRITFRNFGDLSEDISSWRLCSNFNYTFGGMMGDGAITIIDGNYNLSPGEEMTIEWTPSNGFRDIGDDIGIYLATGGFEDPNSMVDFMQYLTPGNGRESVAVAKGIWGVGDFVTGASPFTFSGLGTNTGVNFWSGFIDSDFDADGVADIMDNCIETPNPDQADFDSDGLGDLCDSDMDNDGTPNDEDCAPMDMDVYPGAICDDGDVDTLMDEIQDDCTCAGIQNLDADGDGVLDDLDNCIDIANADQADIDGDGAGDVCDNDIDGDGEFNDEDCDPMDSVIFTGASCDDGDEFTEDDVIQDDCSCQGDPIDLDNDNDGIANDDDNCPEVANADQSDLDEDGIGDVCDIDIDGDNIENDVDNCPEVSNSSQSNLDSDVFGDACDDDIDGDGDLNDEDCDATDPFVFVGAICDDEDPNTTGDTIQNDCTCEGAVGLSDLSTVFVELSIYPNPANDKLYISFNLKDNGITTFEIFDVAGRLVGTDVLDLQIGEVNHYLNTESLNQGIYLMKISIGENALTKRFSVLR